MLVESKMKRSIRLDEMRARHDQSLKTSRETMKSANCVRGGRLKHRNECIAYLILQGTCKYVSTVKHTYFTHIDIDIDIISLFIEL